MVVKAQTILIIALSSVGQNVLIVEMKIPHRGQAKPGQLDLRGRYTNILGAVTTKMPLMFNLDRMILLKADGYMMAVITTNIDNCRLND